MEGSVPRGLAGPIHIVLRLAWWQWGERWFFEKLVGIEIQLTHLRRVSSMVPHRLGSKKSQNRAILCLRQESKMQKGRKSDTHKVK